MNKSPYCYCSSQPTHWSETRSYSGVACSDGCKITQSVVLHTTGVPRVSAITGALGGCGDPYPEFSDYWVGHSVGVATCDPQGKLWPWLWDSIACTSHDLPGHWEIYQGLGPYGPRCSYATASHIAGLFLSSPYHSRFSPGSSGDDQTSQGNRFAAQQSVKTDFEVHSIANWFSLWFCLADNFGHIWAKWSHVLSGVYEYHKQPSDFFQ